MLYMPAAVGGGMNSSAVVYNPKEEAYELKALNSSV